VSHSVPTTLAIRAALVATASAAALVTALPELDVRTSLPALVPASVPAGPAAAPALSGVVGRAAFDVVPVPTATSGSAVQSALSKIGKPYRWGATGPNAFDCSGLVVWSFKQAGVSLPRSSRAISQVGIPVSRVNLQPGDLVFFYKPVSHVGIYIGNGKIVHASTRKSPVKVSDMSRMPFNSARRV